MSKTIKLVAGCMLFLALCLLLPASSAFSEGRKPEVQVQTEYTIGPAQSDASRAIDMAERVTTQGQQITQTQLLRVEAKLDRISEKLDLLDRRLAAIEQHLGIVPPPLPVAPPPQQSPAKPAKPAR